MAASSRFLLWNRRLGRVARDDCHPIGSIELGLAPRNLFSISRARAEFHPAPLPPRHHHQGRIHINVAEHLCRFTLIGLCRRGEPMSFPESTHRHTTEPFVPSDMVPEFCLQDLYNDRTALTRCAASSAASPRSPSCHTTLAVDFALVLSVCSYPLLQALMQPCYASTFPLPPHKLPLLLFLFLFVFISLSLFLWFGFSTFKFYFMYLSLPF